MLELAQIYRLYTFLLALRFIFNTCYNSILFVLVGSNFSPNSTILCPIFSVVKWSLKFRNFYDLYISESYNFEIFEILTFINMLFLYNEAYLDIFIKNFQIHKIFKSLT